MPYAAFSALVGSTELQTEFTTDPILRKAFRYIRGESSVSTSLIRAGRSRSSGRIGVAIEGSMDVGFKRQIRLNPIMAEATIETRTQYFLNATPAVPPAGNLRLPSVNQLLSKNYIAQAFNGSQQHTRGDQIIIQFVVRGQRMDGLRPAFYACRTDQPSGSPHDLTKGGNEISMTDPVRDTTNGLETMSGSFFINPNDTIGLPDGTLEFTYEFKLSDGLGRTFTLERGRFKISSHC